MTGSAASKPPHSRSWGRTSFQSQENFPPGWGPGPPLQLCSVGDSLVAGSPSQTSGAVPGNCGSRGPMWLRSQSGRGCLWRAPSEEGLCFQGRRQGRGRLLLQSGPSPACLCQGRGHRVDQAGVPLHCPHCSVFVLGVLSTACVWWIPRRPAVPWI